MTSRTGIGVTLLLSALALAGPVYAGSADLAQSDPARPCMEEPAFSLLDFWLGEWEVYAGDRLVGTSRVEKILSGCAVMEHWSAAGGGDGKGLFYYDPRREVWKQVWVTEDTIRPGGLKEKRLVERLENGGTRFQTELSHPERGTYLDRTNLLPLPEGRVHQVIEVSVDGGETWRPVFDAVYVRPGGER